VSGGSRTRRAITGFRQDAEGDWVAELACLHSQHMRHNPPLNFRPWVTDAGTRQAQIGTEIGCPLCDRAELPAELTLLRTAGPFTDESLPAGLRRTHHTAEGTWGVLRVLAGVVRCQLEVCPPLDVVLAAGSGQPLPPGIAHRIEPDPPARLAVEFWGRTRDGRQPDAHQPDAHQQAAP
jgi:tellurite methyltransferase